MYDPLVLRGPATIAVLVTSACVFDHWYYAFAPAGEDVVGAQTSIRVDGVESEHQIFDYGEHPMGIIPDQDVAKAVFEHFK